MPINRSYIEQSRNKGIKSSLSVPISKYIEVSPQPKDKNLKNLDKIELDLLYKLENYKNGYQAKPRYLPSIDRQKLKISRNQNYEVLSMSEIS